MKNHRGAFLAACQKLRNCQIKYGRHRSWRKSLLWRFMVYVQVLYHFYYCFS